MTKKNFKKMINTIMVLDAMVDAMVLNAIMGNKPAPATDNDERKGELDARERELNQRERYIEDRENAVDERECELDERERELDDREYDIERREEGLSVEPSVEEMEHEHNELIKDTIFGFIDGLADHIANLANKR